MSPIKRLAALIKEAIAKGQTPSEFVREYKSEVYETMAAVEYQNAIQPRRGKRVYFQ